MSAKDIADLFDKLAAAEKEIKRLKRILLEAPHGALCKKGFQNLFDPGGKCTCWKKEIAGATQGA